MFEKDNTFSITMFIGDLFYQYNAFQKMNILALQCF